MSGRDRAGLRDPPHPRHPALRLPQVWDQLAKDLGRIYSAPSAEAAWAAFEELEGIRTVAITESVGVYLTLPGAAWAQTDDDLG